MKLLEIKQLLKAEVLTANADLDREPQFVRASDLMSDVLSAGHFEGILITGLTNAQSVRTAHMVELEAICYVRGKKPGEETIQLAQDKDIILMATDFTMFKACGILYNNMT